MAGRGLRREQPSNATVARYAVGVVGVFLAAFVAIGLLTGLGFGWINALGVPNAVRSFLSPVTTIAQGLDWVLVSLGVIPDADLVVPTAAGRSGRRPARRHLDGVQVQGAAPGPHPRVDLARPGLHRPRRPPRYILWGGLLFAMTESGQLARRIVVWATCGLAMYSVVDAAWRSSVVAVGVTAALALVWITTGHDRDHPRQGLRQVASDPGLSLRSGPPGNGVDPGSRCTAY